MSDDLAAMFDEAYAAAEGVDISDSDELSGGADVNMGDDLQIGDDTEDIDTNSGTEDEPTDTEEGTPSDSTFDWATYKDQMVKVKVQGEEIELPLGEALNGYMRQADYTKKTQAVSEDLKLSAWAKQLRDAFQTDPAGAIQYLQQAYQVQTQTVNPYEDIDPELQPLVQTVREQQQIVQQLQTQLQAVEQDRILNEVRAEVAQVRAEFPDFDATTVLPVAAERGLNIRDAYLLVNAEKVIMSRNDVAKATADAQQVAEREAQKRKNAAKTQSTSNVAGKPTSTVPEFDSFEDLLNWNMKNAG